MWGEAVARLSERDRSRCWFVPIRGPPCRSAIVGRQAGHLSGEPCPLVAKIAQGDLHGGELPPQNGLALLEAKVPLLDLAREVARQVFLALDRLRAQSRPAVAGQLQQRPELCCKYGGLIRHGGRTLDPIAHHLALSCQGTPE